MIDQEEFPDARAAVFDLIDGQSFAGHEVLSFYHIPANDHGQIDPATLPFALIFSDGGSVGYLDQVEQVTVEVYGDGELAMKVAKEIRQRVCGQNLETAQGFFDAIKADRVPSDAPYSGYTMKATLLLAATSRPL